MKHHTPPPPSIPRPLQDDNSVKELKLTNGQTVQGDLYISAMPGGACSMLASVGIAQLGPGNRHHDHTPYTQLLGLCSCMRHLALPGVLRNMHPAQITGSIYHAVPSAHHTILA